jgi:hypothetical protein
VNPIPSWSLEPGHVFRTGEYDVHVVDLVSQDVLILTPGTLVLSGGGGLFLLMATGTFFTLDELDSRILEFESVELLS